MKRQLETGISIEFIDVCEKKFKSEPTNIIVRNAITSVGSILSTIDSSKLNRLDHIFLNSVKKKSIKATNQGQSGRCWMFASLNIFRYILINALDLNDFEFSETYLFFWDKFERSNQYLKWFIENLNLTADDKPFDYMISDYMSDGGWWNTFTNLVMKYGLVPISAMKETFQSEDSEHMNFVIQNQLTSTINYILKNKRKLNSDELSEIRKTSLENIYNILVKFLGEPPKKFDWNFVINEEPNSITNLTPLDFLEMVIPDTDMKEDFVVLTNIPTSDMKMYQKYNVNLTSNVEGGFLFSFFNVPINEMTKYVSESITNGLAVWFAGDVTKCYNPYHACLDDKINQTENVFPKTFSFSKGERMTLKNIESCHAMLFTGFNKNEKNQIINWQVENSWGYADKDEAGLDGFLTMSQSWFEKYVIKIVIHKKFLSRSFLKEMENSNSIQLEPWTNIAPQLLRIRK